MNSFSWLNPTPNTQGSAAHTDREPTSSRQRSPKAGDAEPQDYDYAYRD